MRANNARNSSRDSIDRPPSKRCCDCELTKQSSEFYSTTTTADGLASTCVMCTKRRVIEYNEKHPEHNRLYRQSHPELNIAAINRRRARKVAAGGTLTANDIASIRKRCGGRCTYCGKPAKPLHMDHIVALDNGGSNDKSNITVACGNCNQRKHARPVWDFLAELVGIKPEEMRAIL